MVDDQFTTSILKLIREKDSFMSTSDKRLLKNFNEIEVAIYKAVKKTISSLNQEGGKISFDETNTNEINKINKIIRDAIQGSSYPSQVKTYLRDFDQVKEYNQKTHEDLNSISNKEFEKIVGPIQKTVVDQTLEGLLGAGISTNFSDPLRTGIFQNVVSGTTFENLESLISAYILTDPGNLGKFKRYVGQISRDALNQYDGQVNARIAEDLGLNAFRYVGSLIDDSRIQCRRWVFKEVLLKEDLPGEIAWAINNGSGMIPSTDAENFAVYRGGYNCRHSAIPFKMTKSQLAEYNKNSPKVEEDFAKELKKEEKIDTSLLSQAEKDLDLTFNQSPLIPSNLAQVVKDEAIPDQVFELSDNGTFKQHPGNVNSRSAGFFYHPTDKFVQGNIGSDRWNGSKYYRGKVVIHEYAHRTHFEKELFGFEVEKNDPISEAAFLKSRKLILDKIKKEKLGKSDFSSARLYEKHFVQIQAAGFTFRDFAEMSGAYLDTIQALTNERFGSGHKKGYMKKFGGAFARFEWFAHAAENYFGKNIVFQLENPELYDLTLEYFSENVAKKYLPIKKQ